MVYSAAINNFERVALLYTIAEEYHQTNKRSGQKERWKSGDIFPFSVEDWRNIQNESQIVEAVIVFSLITLESLANHIIAEKTEASELTKEFTEKDTIDLSIGLIEGDYKAFSKIGIKRPPKGDLSKKIKALDKLLSSKPSHYIETLQNIANKLSEARNSIVHDKPFDLTTYDDGNIEFTEFRNRGKSKIYDFEFLENFFIDCQKIANYFNSFETEEVDFNYIKKSKKTVPTEQ